MMSLLLHLTTLLVLFSGGWQPPQATPDDPVFVFSGWNAQTNRAAWDLYNLSLSGTSKLIVGSRVNKVYAFPFPNERAIGYLTERSGTEERQIVKYDLDTGTSTPLGISIYADSTCRVSPDGKQLACGDLVGKQFYQIVVFDLATRTKRQLTSFNNYSTDPSWSPDGKSLVYATGDETEKVGGENKPRGKHLAVYDFATGTSRLLTRQSNAADGYPRWSPDGQWIAFHRPGKGGKGWHIWMIHPDGTGETELTVTDYEDSHPEWSADSARIAFQSYRSNKSFDVYLVDVATKSLTRVTATDKVEEEQPIWIAQAKR